MGDDNFKYWAFISYSHEDKAWGDWLHRALETYRVPKRLVGRQTGGTAVPRRLFPIFRDREELPSSADLSNNISDALDSSRYLVVICSSRAAVSRWVNEEIRSFKQLGREGRILALIVDGEPNASDKPGSGKLECFPEALRHRVSPDGVLLPERVEAIAADVRPGKDGKANALLKLLAGLLGVPYDELRQREKQRQRLRKIQWVAGVLVCAVLVGSGWMWQTHRKATQLAIAQDTEQGRVLFLDHKPLQASVYLAEAYRLGGRSPALLFLLARTMHYVDALRFAIASPTLAGRQVSADLSPDGRWLAFSGADPDTGVWDVATGTQKYPTLAPGLVQVDPMFSPSGKYLVLVSRPTPTSPFESIRVLDPGSGTVVSRFGNPNIQATVGNNPDLDVVDSVVGPDDVIMLRHGIGDDIDDIHELSTGKLLARLDGRGVTMQFARFSPDGKTVARVSQNQKSLTLWDASTGRKQDSFRGEAFPAFNFDMDTDGTRIATANTDGVVRIWDLRSGRGLFVLNDPRNPKTDAGDLDAAGLLHYLPDGTRLVTGGARSVQVWDAAQGALLARLGQVKLTTLNVKHDGSLIMGSTADNMTLIWDAGSYGLVGSLPGDWSVFPHRGDSLVTFSDQDNLAQVWDSSRLLPATGAPPRTLGYSRDEARLATWDANAINVRDAHSGAVLFSIPTDIDIKQFPDPTFRPDINAIFSPDGRHLLVLREGYEYASTPVPGRVSLWDATDGHKIAELKGHGTLQTTSLSADGRVIFTCDDDHTGGLWDGGTGATLSTTTFPSGCLAARLSPDGKQAAVLHSGGRQFAYRYELWDLKTQRQLTALPEEFGSVWGVAYSPDGRTVATADNQGMIRVRDLSHDAPLRSWDSGAGPARLAVYSPDARQLTTVHANGLIKTWILSTGALSWQYKAGSSGTDVEGYSADGRFLLINDGSDGWGLLDAATGAVLMRGDGASTAGWIATGRLMPSGKRILTRVGDQGVLLDIDVEDRPPTEVASLVACRVPWQLVKGQLLPTHPLADHCPPVGPSRPMTAAAVQASRPAPVVSSRAPSAATLHAKTGAPAVTLSIQDALKAIAAKRFADAFREFTSLAKQGDSRAETYLGRMYADGMGTNRDLARAAYWYQKAAAQGDALGEDSLGYLYERGRGVPQDHAKAAALYQDAVDHGNADAATRLGILYMHGDGVEQDFPKAAELLQVGAESGDAIAAVNLGALYVNGQGVTQDSARAFALFHKAADLGNADGDDHLGYLYARGEGVAQSYSKANEYYRKGADLGNADAQFAMGTLYAFGHGVPQDYAAAAKWWTKAADQGYADAQYDLGVLYETGQGVPKDLDKALELFTNASKQGHAEAKEALHKLLQTYNPFDKSNNGP